MVKKLIYGVGVNDSLYQVVINQTISGKQKRLWICPFYQTWTSMLLRCYNEKKRWYYRTYSDCIAVDEWHKFSCFRAWMEKQDWQGKQLDKDILLNGNRIYGPESCVFIPARLNLFLVDRRLDRGEWPLGVSFSRSNSNFRAQCCNPFTGKNEHLGYFFSPEQAHEAWRAKKHEHALRYADMQADSRIAQALRERYITGGNYD
ncbi:MAG: hypothetical protein K5804_17875 [Microbacterium sp.]|uniref:hypothetical protein n=1 Tax=Microbacterium sp. TaxID=51671 RepID=UPI0026098058|nr:hypothetical protein [Microbacterium sp.]MCV0420114.1 hypothetical protein [Microbacterium sp.]